MMSSNKISQPKNDDVFVSKEKQGFHELPTNSRKLRPRKESIVSEIEICKKIREIEKKQHLDKKDLLYLDDHRKSVSLVKQRRSSYKKLKERAKEMLDDDVTLDQKSAVLANLLLSSHHVIVYTGAGISTSANIPDYRGVDGVWTKLKAGENIVMNSGLVNAIPTYTHMCIKALIEKGIVKHVVSQNCDGLHVKSGISERNLSEIHGNMFCEVCSKCEKPYYRIFDVTEHTSLRKHSTHRSCDKCNGLLRDTIVHFGEHSDENWPHNWQEAKQNAEKADLILCLGSSLKVLRSYKMLWLTDRPKPLRPKLAIINIQWTPKDSQATLKINGRVDDVLLRVIKFLDLKVDEYNSDKSVIFEKAVSIKPTDYATFNTQCITIPPQHLYKFQEANQYKNATKNLHTIPVQQSCSKNQKILDGNLDISESNLKLNTEKSGSEISILPLDLSMNNLKHINGHTAQCSSSYTDFNSTHLMPNFNENSVNGSIKNAAVTLDNNKNSESLSKITEIRWDSEEKTVSTKTENSLVSSPPNTLVPAWFGKGCRKQVVKKICKRKRSKKQNTS